MARKLSEQEIIQAFRKCGMHAKDAKDEVAFFELARSVQQLLENYFSAVGRKGDKPAQLVRWVLRKIVNEIRTTRLRKPYCGSLRSWAISLAMKKRSMPSNTRRRGSLSKLQKELSRLPQEYSELFALRDWFECSEEEICGILVISAKTCRKLNCELDAIIDGLSGGNEEEDTQ